MGEIKISEKKKQKIQTRIDNFNPKIKENYDNVDEIIESIIPKVKNIEKYKNRKYFYVQNCFYVPRSYIGTKKFMQFGVCFNKDGSIKNIEIEEGYSTKCPYGSGEEIKILPNYRLIEQDFKLYMLKPDIDISDNYREDKDNYNFVMEAVAEKLKDR